MVSASQGTAHLLATLVLVQAIIAGRSDRPFGSWDIGVHEILGNSVFDVALVGLVLAVVARQGRASIACAAALLMLVTAQADSATPGEPAPRRRRGTSPTAWPSSASPSTTSPPHVGPE